MTESMVERCAKAIYDARNGHGATPWSRLQGSHKDPYRMDARAVLEALKTPTPEMVGAGWEGYWNHTMGDEISHNAADAVFTAMIQAALDKGEGR